ncbi:hypothetical protein HCN44_003009 [Aphidius gifuensis]|uniref:Uncharacterized protein n=1 Tax=Aphidius gifuensis TaxID=684658 RepID=A0A834XK86_APHGI|nr:uncharacterized protein LOC122859333 [Aphidius gifuensis]KAF7987247.1 hypothetical protein HCN44_003009 [Aphidius gifuensis]
MGEKAYYRFPSAVSHGSVLTKSIYEEFRSSKDSTADKSWYPSQENFHKDECQDLSNNFSQLHLNFKNNNKKSRRSKNSNKSIRRIDSLSRPKYYTEKFTNDDDKKTSAIDLTPLKPNRYREVTPRLLRLAEPKFWYPTPTNPLGKVPAKALRANASKRILELATPKWRTETISKQDETDRNNSNDKSSQDKSEIKKISLIKNHLSTPLSKVLQSYLDRVYKGPFKN